MQHAAVLDHVLAPHANSCNACSQHCHLFDRSRSVQICSHMLQALQNMATYCFTEPCLWLPISHLTNHLAPHALQERPLLFGVDVCSSRMFKQQRVLAAVEFAAAAHAGQKRKTGEPYVSHCIETALIVEANLPHWRHDHRCDSATKPSQPAYVVGRL